MNRKIEEIDNIIKVNPIMVNLNDLPESIRCDIIEFCENNDININDDMYMKLATAIDHYLMWDGIMGYTNNIIEIIETAKSCDIKINSI